MTFLLDVNVLIALVDPAHVAHDVAHEWFEEGGQASWATCPITENGLVRILGHPRYPHSPGSPSAIAAILDALRRLQGHCFWPDDIGLVSSNMIDVSKIFTPAQVTDTYLLALARAHGGRLATLDRRLSVGAVSGGKAVLHCVDLNPMRPNAP